MLSPGGTQGTDRAEGIDPHRIAEVIVVTAAGRRRGSGYLVGPGVVLTAAHVVAGAQDTVVRFDSDRAGEWSAQTTAAWVDPRSDLAVLRIGTRTGVAPVRYGRVADDRHEVIDAHAAGFPLWKRRDVGGRVFRELHIAHGTVAALSNLRTGTLELTVPPAGDDPDPGSSPWAGMSGAAVWVGSRIVGVVAEHHRPEGTGRLTAVRLDHALRGIGDAERRELASLLALPEDGALPVAGRVEASAGGEAEDDRPLRVVGIPVAYGIELFKNRTRERDAVAERLSDPAIRLVTVTGRRGIGKSALAAKVMDQLERGEWPGTAAGPVPSGLVNLSTRTSGISVERVYFDCARLLGPAAEALLTDAWTAGGSVQDRLAALGNAIGERLIVILLDNLEELLHDDGSVADQDLAALLDWLFRARRATPRLLATSQVPLRLAPELRRFAVQVPLSEGLQPAEAAALLRELDQDGSLGIAELSDDELLDAAVRVHGIPRALELLVGAVADDELGLASLRDMVRDLTRREDIVAELAGDRYRRLDPPARTVLWVLAALRTPVRQDAVEEIVAGLDPELPVAHALDTLVRVHLLAVDRRRHTVALHPLDADIAYGELSKAALLGRETVERHIASWYAGQAGPAGEWRTLDELEPLRRQFNHLVRAGDYDAAARVLAGFSPWLVWHGSVLIAVSMHLAVHGRIGDERVRLDHTIGYAHARLSAGPMEEAVELFAGAVGLAESLNDQVALQSALFGLGDAERQLGRLGAALAPLARAADLAHELGDGAGEMHSLLSLSLAHSYLREGGPALEIADRLSVPAAATGDPLARARAGNARTIALLTLGRWAETIEAATGTVRDYRAAGSREAVAYALNAQGLALLALDAPPQAVAVLEEARHEAMLMENPRAEGVCLLNLAWAHWRDGRPGQSAETADRASTALDIAGAAQAAAARALAEAARALAAQPAEPEQAVAALYRAAAALDGNAEIISGSWLTEQANRLTN